MENFIEILNDLILESNLSLRELEKRSGVTAMQYSRYLRGSIPTIQVIIKIAYYFDCSIDYLFGLSKDKASGKFKTKNFNMSNFISKYEKLLKENNITHYKFAQQNLLNESIIRHWKSGKTPRLDNLYLIAFNLGCSIDYLIGRE